MTVKLGYETIIYVSTSSEKQTVGLTDNCWSLRQTYYYRE